MTFNVVLAEDEDSIAEMGWEPFSVDRGFARGENVVTVQSVIELTQPVNAAGKDALNHVQIISDVIGHAFHLRAYLAIRHRRSYPLIVIGPAMARAIAEGGWNKNDIKQYLYDNVRMPAALVEKYARNNNQNDYDLKDLVERKIIPPEYYESEDPNRLVRVLVEPQMTGIVVAGDQGRNQSKGFVQNHRQGVPVSKKIRLPGNWQGLLKQSNQR